MGLLALLLLSAAPAPLREGANWDGTRRVLPPCLPHTTGSFAGTPSASPSGTPSSTTSLSRSTTRSTLSFSPTGTPSNSLYSPTQSGSSTRSFAPSPTSSLTASHPSRSRCLGLNPCIYFCPLRISRCNRPDLYRYGTPSPIPSYPTRTHLAVLLISPLPLPL